MKTSRTSIVGHRLGSRDWFIENKQLLLIGLALFLLNQLIEFVLLRELAPYGYNSLCRLDCRGYASIVLGGYKAEIANEQSLKVISNWAFFPLFPAFAKFFHLLLGFSPEKAVVGTGKLFFLGSIILFMKFAKAYIPMIPLSIAGAVVALNPYAIYGNVGYTEPLFLFFSCLFFLFLKKRQFLLAGISGAFLGSVRLVGIFSGAPYLHALFSQWSSLSLSRRLRVVVGLLLIPVGLGMFMLHLYQRTGDALAFIHIQQAWGRPASLGPLSWLQNLIDGFTQEFYLSKYNAITSLIAFFLSFYLLRKRYYDLAVFSLLCTLLPLSSSVWGMPRYIWWQAPILLAVASLIGNNKRRAVVWFGLALIAQFICYRQWFSPYDWYISMA